MGYLKSKSFRDLIAFLSIGTQNKTFTWKLPCNSGRNCRCPSLPFCMCSEVPLILPALRYKVFAQNWNISEFQNILCLPLGTQFNEAAWNVFCHCILEQLSTCVLSTFTRAGHAQISAWETWDCHECRASVKLLESCWVFSPVILKNPKLLRKNHWSF